MSLTNIIIDKIRKEGPISFHDFMEMCLYHPGLGYYTCATNRIGRKGDYYTSSTVGPAMGAMIARQVEEMWLLLGREPFTIVEYGAGPGLLCQDILSHLKGNDSLYRHLSYCIIEKSPAMRALSQSRLAGEKVSWHESIEELSGINGCILSNELLDNFSVHKVVAQNELMEVFVDCGNRFEERLMPASERLKNYFDEQNVHLPEGFCTEVNIEATEWMQKVSAALDKGWVLTIDYGYSAKELYGAHRNGGTIMCYNKHTTNTLPYSNIGEQDITAHVNFTALRHWGSKYGLTNCGYTDQAHFLISLGLEDYLQNARSNNSLQDRNMESFMLHTLLVSMGNKFKVLIQQKEIPETKLAGFKYDHSSSL